MSEHTLPPVVEDLSTYVAGGRSEPGAALLQAVDAERLGFRRVWIAERYGLKDVGVLMGSIAARTSRIGVGSGPVTAMARTPAVTASMGATLNAVHGPRCVIGIGRGPREWLTTWDLPEATSQGLIDYADIMKRLWRGESITYNGPVGRFTDLQSTDLHDGPPPEIWYCHMGGPRASRTSANPAFDGVMLTPGLTPEAVRESVEISRKECEAIGRDPATLRICAAVPTAPIPDDPSLLGEGSMNAAYGGLFTEAHLKPFIAVSLQSVPEMMVGILRRNRWDTDVIRQVNEHPMFAGMTGISDHLIKDRSQFMEVAHLLPDSWIEESCAYGSTDDCVRKLREFREVGADEVAIYCSAPAQSADVIAAWAKSS